MGTLWAPLASVTCLTLLSATSALLASGTVVASTDPLHRGGLPIPAAASSSTVPTPATATPSASRSQTPTVVPPMTPTASPKPTHGPRPSKSPTASRSRSTTPTSTPAPTETETPAPTRRPTPSKTPTASPTPIASPSVAAPAPTPTRVPDARSEEQVIVATMTRVANPELPVGKERILGTPINGLAKVTFVDGVEVKRTVLRPPVDGITEYGTGTQLPDPPKVVSATCTMVGERTAQVVAKVSASSGSWYAVELNVSGRTDERSGIGTQTFTFTVNGPTQATACSARVVRSG